MKKFYKIVIGTVNGCVLGLALICFNLLNNVASEIGNEKDKYEKYVGEKHIIDKDTLTITDYSIIEETFTLSNGQRVNYKMVTN